MSGPERTHVQFTGVLQPEDARTIVGLLREAIKRRPPMCGAFLRTENLGGEPSEKLSRGIGCTIEEAIEGLK